MVGALVGTVALEMWWTVELQVALPSPYIVTSAVRSESRRARPLIQSASRPAVAALSRSEVRYFAPIPQSKGPSPTLMPELAMVMQSMHEAMPAEAHSLRGQS